MSTGIPPKENTNRKLVPINITYDGKTPADEILIKQYSDFSIAQTINSGNDNHFYFGDNLNALLYLFHTGYKGKIRLIYIDPPFATASNFVNRNQQQAYSDLLCGGKYVEFLRERLIVMRELLSDDGSLYLHLDGNMVFTLKLILDEVFGEKIFVHLLHVKNVVLRILQKIHMVTFPIIFYFTLNLQAMFGTGRLNPGNMIEWLNNIHM